MGQRHHYLPVFYLRRWAGDDARVCQYSRPRVTVVPKRVHPSGTAFQENLYSIPHVAPHLTHWLEENFFKQVDQEANDAIKRLVDGDLDLTPKLRSGLSRFLMSLMSRTPERVAQIRAEYAVEFDKLGETFEQEYDAHYAGRDDKPSPEEKAAAIARARELGAGRVIQAAIDLPNVGRHLNNMPFSIITLPDLPLTLLTSDRPLYMSKGLKYDDVLVTFPLSPRKLFLAANDVELLRRFRGLVPVDLAMQANRTVVQQAVRFVYGMNDSLGNFVERNLRM